MVAVYDKENKMYLEGEDGELLGFTDEVAAKNYLFSCGFKYEFVQQNFDFPNYLTADLTRQD